MVTGGGLTELAGPPVEQVAVERVILPEPGIIRVEVVNDGPQEVTIPQVIVDDAYFMFEANPSTTIPRLGRSSFTIYYPWWQKKPTRLCSLPRWARRLRRKFRSRPDAPDHAGSLSSIWLDRTVCWHRADILGLLWYPFMRRLSKAAINFILALTVGLLVYLAIGTWLDANEFAAELPAFWQGVPLVVLVALISLGVLLAVGSLGRRGENTPLGIAYRIAFGIGLHNLGEGLAIGAAFASGELHWALSHPWVYAA